MIARWSSSCVVSGMDPCSLTPKVFLHPGEFDGMDANRGELRRMIQQWITESRTMYADARETIQNSKAGSGEAHRPQSDDTVGAPHRTVGGGVAGAIPTIVVTLSAWFVGPRTDCSTWRKWDRPLRLPPEQNSWPSSVGSDASTWECPCSDGSRDHTGLSVCRRYGPWRGSSVTIARSGSVLVLTPNSRTSTEEIGMCSRKCPGRSGCGSAGADKPQSSLRQGRKV